MPTITIDKTDGCQVYLSKDSLNTEIVTSKISEVNILVPDSQSGEFVRFTKFLGFAMLKLGILY